MELHTFVTGNEYLHRITNSGNYSLRIEMSSETDNQKHPLEHILKSEYSRFRISSESSGYKISELSGNSGSAGDVMGIFSSNPLANVSFLTYDTRNPDAESMGNNNAHHHSVSEPEDQGGWWHPHEHDQLSDINSSSGKASLLHRKTCYTNLNAAHPVYCDTHGKQRGIISVRMFIRR